MSTRGDLALLATGLRAAGAFGVRLMVAAGLLLSGLLVYVLLALFPGPPANGGGPVHLYRALLSAEDPALLRLFLVAAGTILFAIWSVFGGAVLRYVVLAQRGKPAPVSEALSHSVRHWTSHLFAPVLLLLALGLGVGVVALLVSVSRIPYIGWPLLLVLSPAILAVSGAAVWLALRWLIGGHLVGSAVAADGVRAFGAVSRMRAYARRAPIRILWLRLLALLLVLAHSLLRVGVIAAAVALPVYFLDGSEASDVAVMVAILFLLVLAAFALAWPVALSFGAHASLYLIHRRDLDGSAIACEESDPEREKSLVELGIELEQSLGQEPV